jgi:mannose-6-phosphate isomerase
MKRISDKRPWGGFEQFTLNEKSTVKILFVKPGKRNSLQKHCGRAEFWRALDNPVWATVGTKRRKMKKGDEVMIKKGQLHRLEGIGKVARVLEISLGNFNEKDIKRVEDDFGRADSNFILK